MIYIAVISLALTVGFVVFLVGELIPARSRAMRQRLAEVEALTADPNSVVERRNRLARRERVMAFLEVLGSKLQPGKIEGDSGDRLFLIQAGYRNPGAVPIYWGIRIALPLTLGILAFLTAPIMRLTVPVAMLYALYFIAMGWVGPVFFVRFKRTKRQKDIQKALPDALDLMVVCVEAGLGLNQALVRVSDEIRHVSTLTSVELGIVNAEIRAGAARDLALRNLADRTGLDDVRSLVTMLIQTDRFGTSIARALRVHSDTMRQKRRQRAEEAAAKTAIKMIFPLVICIFPALFVVLIGPGLIQIFETLGSVM
jgi:tight adherence protein C